MAIFDYIYYTEKQTTMKQHKTINLINETHYLSKDLRRFFAIVLKNYKKTNYDFKPTSVTVKCTYSSNNIVTVTAYRDSAKCEIKLPKQIALFNKSDSLRNANNKIGIFDEATFKEKFEDQVAKNFTWALEYMRGFNRKISQVSNFLKEELLIGEKKPIVKSKKTANDKLKALLKRKKLWTSKMKRCENAISKIEKQIKYYEKRVS